MKAGLVKFTMLCATVAVAAYLLYSQQGASQESRSNGATTSVPVINAPHTASQENPLSDIGDFAGNYISSAIYGAVGRGYLTAGDLEKLDFSVAGDPGFGSHPDMELFNPAGRIFPILSGGVPVKPRAYI